VNIDISRFRPSRLFNCIVHALAFLLVAQAPMVQAHDHPGYSHDAGINYNNADWMHAIPGNRLLRDLSLPGTHDTMTYTVGDPITQTQSMSLPDQLNAGIRALDIRCRRSDNRFAIHHGIVYLHKNFDDVLQDATRFLAAHPSETLLMRVKEEHTASNSSLSFAEIFANYANDPRYSAFFWRSGDTNPTLDAVRGKIVVMRDFGGGTFGLPYGDDNGTFHIQDRYSVTTNWDLYDKWNHVKNQLHHANQRQSGAKFYMNYLSASGGSFPYFIASGHITPGTTASRLSTGLTTPAFSSYYPDFPRVGCFIGICTIAFEGTNVLSANHLDSAGLEFVGILMADFPGRGLIDNVIRLNAATVTLFADAAYSGARQSLGLGSHNIGSLRIGNDRLSSLKVPPGYRVTLYEHANFSGNSKRISADTTMLNDFNDVTSSLVVEADGALRSVGALGNNETLTSADGRFRLVMQADGNLVLYQYGQALWASGTNGARSARMQADGNFVLYDAANRAVWASHSAGHPGARLVLQDDGNLVVYDAYGRALWASNTCCR
jgi:hypothetical protein